LTGKFSDLEDGIANYIAELLAIWRRTAAYETLALENRDDVKVVALEAPLVLLFTRLLVALSQIEWNYLSSYTEAVLGPEARQEVLQALKVQEDEVHTQASRFLQWKQMHMLEEMQRNQATMASKIDELVTAKVQKLEEKMIGELRALRESLRIREPMASED
jgi:hypothetical protein